MFDAYQNGFMVSWNLRGLKSLLRSSTRSTRGMLLALLVVVAGVGLAYLLVHMIRRWRRREGLTGEDCLGRDPPKLLFIKGDGSKEKCIRMEYCDEIQGQKDGNGRCSCPTGTVWNLSKKRCESGGSSGGGGGTQPGDGKSKYWTCSKDGTSVGSVVVGWAGGKQFTKGITEADGKWACNYGEQAIPACGGKCTVVASNVAVWRGDNAAKKNANEPTDHAIIAYNNKDGNNQAIVHKVYPNNGPKDNPYDKGINDKKAGGIKAVWVPRNMKLCLKNRRGGADDKYTLSGGTEGNGKLYTQNIPAKDDADDAWLITGTQSC